MNYKKIYDNLISSRRNRVLISGEYYEKHHIIPKSLGGSNKKENIIKLTAREHFIAHWLLYKAAMNTNERIKMANAFNYCRQGKDGKVTSRQYEIVRKIFSKEWAIHRKGKYIPPKNKEQWRKNISLGVKRYFEELTDTEKRLHLKNWCYREGRYSRASVKDNCYVVDPEGNLEFVEYLIEYNKKHTEITSKRLRKYIDKNSHEKNYRTFSTKEKAEEYQKFLLSLPIFDTKDRKIKVILPNRKVSYFETIKDVYNSYKNFYHLNPGRLQETLNGIRSHHKGFKIQYYKED